MARGNRSMTSSTRWKSLEPANAFRGRLSPEQAESHRRQDGLRLSRSRVLQDLEKARRPRQLFLKTFTGTGISVKEFT